MARTTAAAIAVSAPAESVNLEPTWAKDWRKKYMRLDLRLSSLKRDFKTLEKEAVEKLGEFEVGLVDGQVFIRNTIANSTTFDVNSFRRDHPELAEKYTIKTYAKPAPGQTKSKNRRFSVA